VAWIWIPGTNIDYPVVQSHDNEIYLYKDFEGNSISYVVPLPMAIANVADIKEKENIKVEF